MQVKEGRFRLPVVGFRFRLRLRLRFRFHPKVLVRVHVRGGQADRPRRGPWTSRRWAGDLQTFVPEHLLHLQFPHGL